MSLPKSWSRQGSYFIPFRLQLLTRMIEREANRQLHAGAQISVAEWRILAMICTTGPMNAADIASAYEADPGQISRAVAELLRKGMIKRERQVGGGNVKTINPTAEGLRAFEAMHDTRQAYFKSIMSGLSDDELHKFDSVLTHIAQRVDEERNTADPPSPDLGDRSGTP